MFNWPRQHEPRASRIPLPPSVPDLATELWMGGSDSLHGDLVLPEHLAGAWIIDLAGDLPEHYREACALWLPRVFADMEGRPATLHRLQSLARSVADCLLGGVADDGWEHPAEAPSRLFVMCQQGMNRSGLVTGLILRALGASAEESLTAVATRPGALNNLSFARLIRELDV